MVSAYFKNVGQTRTLIQLIQERSEIQQQSGEQMKEKFAHYNLELQEVLIGTPTSGQPGGQIEQILMQLRSRQIAVEQIETYSRQQSAAAKERELREAEARARQQQLLTESEISIQVQSNQGKADYARAQQQAAQIQTLAGAEGEKTRLLGEGEAKKIRALAEAEAERAARVGVAQALAIDEQVRAYGGPQFQMAQQVGTLPRRRSRSRASTCPESRPGAAAGTAAARQPTGRAAVRSWGTWRPRHDRAAGSRAEQIRLPAQEARIGRRGVTRIPHRRAGRRSAGQAVSLAERVI
jgi:hypothetical protein